MDLAAEITKAGSKQTYYTIRFLADRERVQDALRAYAYFRWVDDQLDTDSTSQQVKREFLNRQRGIMDACYKGDCGGASGSEEQMLVDLVKNDTEKDSGLQTYLRSMMDVMSFDVERRGRRISRAELSKYSHMLSRAVTEYMFYFIGHKYPPPCSETRYQAVCGAHTVHMLRDMAEDIKLGYINIPAEILAEEQIALDDMHHPSFRMWVAERAELAHLYFDNGEKFIAQVKSFRCRLAGFAYLARFEWMLRAIERDGYYLRPKYPERKSLQAALWIAWRVFSSLINSPRLKSKAENPVIVPDQSEQR